jgi:Flp pilus assembly pilin Flp
MRHHLQALHASVSRWRLSSSLDVRHDHGASAVEYALIAALIAVVILMSVVLLGSRLGTAFEIAGQI